MEPLSPSVSQWKLPLPPDSQLAFQVQSNEGPQTASTGSQRENLAVATIR